MTLPLRALLNKPISALNILVRVHHYSAMFALIPIYSMSAEQERIRLVWPLCKFLPRGRVIAGTPPLPPVYANTRGGTFSVKT